MINLKNLYKIGLKINLINVNVLSNDNTLTFQKKKKKKIQKM